MRLKSPKMIGSLPNPKKVFQKCLLGLLLIILFFSLVPWQQFALGNGKVIAFSPSDREHTVNSPISGRIRKWYVDEGMRIYPGQSIVDIADNDPQLIARLEAQKSAIKIQIQASQKSILAAKANLKRQKKLYEEGINSKRSYELSQIELANYQNQLSQAEIEMITVNTSIARQKTQIIKAHVAGIIYKRLSGEESVVVKAGDVLASILPDTTSRAVALWIDGNDIPFVRLKQKARLQFEGWPAIQFHGWPEIAVGTFGGKVEFIDPTDNGHGQFRVVIVPSEPWPNRKFLRQGVKVHGWVQLGQVPLWYEVWRQYNGFPPESFPEKESTFDYQKSNAGYIGKP